MMSEDLKRCPFCGETPKTYVRVTQMGGGEDHIDFGIKCPKCGTEKFARLKIYGSCTCVFLDVERTMEKAITAWNMRAEE